MPIQKVGEILSFQKNFLEGKFLEGKINISYQNIIKHFIYSLAFFIYHM